MREPVGTSCPVAELAREAGRLIAARRANDEASLKARPHSAEHTRLEREAELILDRLRTVEAEASQRRATSAAGAMYQLMVASDGAAAAASYAEGQWAGVVGEHDRAVLGCLHSVLAVLEELGGVPRETLPAEWYMSRRSDPHAALAALLPPVDEAPLAVVAQAVA